MDRYGKLYKLHTGQAQPIDDFSYLEGVEQACRDRVIELNKEWIGLEQKAMQQMYRLGQICEEVKRLLPHGHYLTWLRTRGIGESTANSWVNIVEKFELNELDNFVPTAAVKLASPSLPETAREEARNLAASGTQVSTKVAIEIAERYLYPMYSPEHEPKTEEYQTEDASRDRRINPNRIVGTRFSNIRTDRDMSQKDVADKVNELLLSVGAVGFPLNGQDVIAKIEAGQRSLSLLEGLAAASVMRVSPSVFAPWEDGRYDYRC